MPQPKQPADAPKDADPTITSAKMAAGEAYPEGTHPVRPPSEVSHGAPRLEGTYKEPSKDEKPDDTSIVQIQEVPEDWPGTTR
jgi:hypothetical protein